MIRANRFFYTLLFFLLISCRPFDGSAQTSDSLLQEATLENVVSYALKRQPLIRESQIDEQILKYQVKAKLADWYPQLDFTYTYQHNFLLPTIIFNGNSTKSGVNNTSGMAFTVSQNIFNADVLLAAKSKNDVFLQARQQTAATKIEVEAGVTKAFYAVLASEQQIKVSVEIIVRLERSLSDAKAQYDAGVADKTDYKRATIALNNARATQKAQEEEYKARFANLKSLMNYPPSGELKIVYDSAALEQQFELDTLQSINYSSRVEYQILETRKRLLGFNYQYYKWSFLPTISADGAYNFNYLNDEFSKLYRQQYPNSYAGLTLHFPIFQGGKRKYDIQVASYELKRIDEEMVNFRNTANAEYITALSNYKSSLYNFITIKENVALAREVYDVIRLQYRSGIKAYLEVITAETDLRTAEINYYNALYEVLSSKIDVEKSLGNITAK